MMKVRQPWLEFSCYAAALQNRHPGLLLFSLLLLPPLSLLLWLPMLLLLLFVVVAVVIVIVVVVIVIVVVVCCCCNIYFLEVSAFLPLLEYVAKYCCLAKTGVFLKHADSYFPTQDGPMDKRMDKTL